MQIYFPSVACVDYKNTQHQTLHDPTSEKRKQIPTWMWRERSHCWTVQLRSISSPWSLRNDTLELIAASAPRNFLRSPAKGKNTPPTHLLTRKFVTSKSYLNHNNNFTNSSTCFMPAASNNASQLTSLINVAAANLWLIIPSRRINNSNCAT